MGIGLKAVRNEGETWRECVIRNAKQYGLEVECLQIFDRDVAAGSEESDAAWDAMYEWDLGLEVVVTDDDGEPA